MQTPEQPREAPLPKEATTAARVLELHVLDPLNWAAPQVCTRCRKTLVAKGGKAVDPQAVVEDVDTGALEIFTGAGDHQEAVECREAQ